LLVCRFAGLPVCCFAFCHCLHVCHCFSCHLLCVRNARLVYWVYWESVLSQICNFPYTFLCRRGGTRQTECLRGAREGRPWYQVELRCGTEVRIIVG
jgi:hypothetical protein